MTTTAEKLVTAADKNAALAEKYYKALNNKNLSEVAPMLHPEIQFVSPMAELCGQASALEAMKRFSSLARSITIRTKFGSESQAMVAYEVDFGDPIGICRSATLMSFRDGLISRIETFYDARPFEQNLKKDAIFASK